MRLFKFLLLDEDVFECAEVSRDVDYKEKLKLVLFTKMGKTKDLINLWLRHLNHQKAGGKPQQALLPEDVLFNPKTKNKREQTRRRKTKPKK